uniref:Exonuclease domain-containing protein n=1 Tax=Mucochytrium quahogii TaxID=96639 RepID=A0A7S2W9B0_9STRA|mmetsp:Transcript_6461/g.10179  ORF Transcript_6461/g.10179 Transcript_6461/m.10179 type:complete len:175 (+) Transcript_6461:102-626(+)|eukprot:CAMPEP_0203758572 /NCGR_PEP_ID=MMETSP0098-20131031/11429_1 /ASSEMBLY_ACC=CAM_ASM_000208 /TAXON_ID=96639 /ORGANISM=" , Strain NY0313808BC1" /LENGTH=174 /DNA_ID=CAMNT_0050651087 /DNA_START=196 /DNA_END=720 /DNA_ORIENTATION=+
MTVFSVDVEADGPIPGENDYSMVSFGAVIVEEGLTRTFYGKLRPISDKFIPEALAVSKHSREETMQFPEPAATMQEFADWINANKSGRAFLFSDNNGFDAMFISWYFHHFLGENPFGHSSTNISSLYKGMEKSVFVNHKRLRKTKHTHHPVDDAKGNAEALLAMKELGLKINFA